MKLIFLFIIFFAGFSSALVPKENLSPLELYEESDAVVILEFSSGKYIPGLGDLYKICGKVKHIIKGKVEEDICVDDADDYGSECFNRSLSYHYMAFVRKGGAGGYTSLWANDSVFEVEESRDSWVPVKCKVHRSYSVEIGKKHFTDTPYFERISNIAEFAFSKQLKRGAE